MNVIDSRAWLAWAVAAMVPALLGRNPILLAELLGIVLVVHSVWASASSFAGVRWFVRVGAVFTLVGVIFNVLTVHAGTSVFAHLPESWPVVGGPLTVNALVYGVVSGIALFTLVLIGTTAGSLVNWMDLFHATPPRLAPVAVAGSVAWAFLPQSAVAFRQIRESQEMRGLQVRGVGGLLPLLLPLLAGTLERALATAEALEARGFGASLDSGARRQRGGRRVPVLMIGALVLPMSGAYSALTGGPWTGVPMIVAGAALFGLALRVPIDRRARRTRYRQPRWTWRDTAVSGSAAVSAAATFFTSWFGPEALRFNPYPNLAVPDANAPLLIAIALLMVPALMVPPPRTEELPEYAP